jgi:aminocarboxymuconate-semialdehyde decarboxylase
VRDGTPLETHAGLAPPERNGAETHARVGLRVAIPYALDGNGPTKRTTTNAAVWLREDRARRKPMIPREALDWTQAGSPAAIAFTGCDLLVARGRSRAPARRAARGTARARPAARGRVASVGGRRREIVVGGRRVRTIDVHAHCVIPEAYALLGLKVEDHRGPGIEEVGPRRIAEMDAQGIDMEALSINPAWYKADRDLATQVIRIQNERLAEFCGRYPDRFVAFASVALQFPELAVQQLVDGVKRLGLRGAAVGASVAGDEFADPKFHPFWAKAEELGVLIFIHPQSTPDLARRLKGNGWLANTIGNPLDTTIALSHLIFEGTLDRFPGLKICSAHGGGFLPSYAARSDNSLRVAPDMDTGIKLKKKPTEYLRRMYYDTLVFTAEALRHLAAEVGVSQLMIGTDHPIPWQDKSVDHILKTPGFSDAERRAMLGETAAKLLKV